MQLNNILSNSEIEELTTELNRENISVDKFLGLVGGVLDETDFETIRNKKSWLRAVIKRLKEEHQEDLRIKKVRVATVQLTLRLEKLGYTHEDYEPCLLDLVCTHILSEFPVDESELQDTINKIIDYISKKKIDKTFGNLITYLTQSKLRATVPLEQLTEEAKEYNMVWKELLMDIGESKEITTEEALNMNAEDLIGGKSSEVRP